jgi:hypothetical protein
MDPAGIPALQDAIKHLHGLDSTWLESVPVRETHGGNVVWEGDVQVFAVEHPQASRAYAWSHATEGDKRRFHVVLGAPPVDSAQAAVRVVIVGEFKRSQN